MKNTLKKVLCTALAAVSLSAMVTVPSSLNATKSDNAIVNVMEADAANGYLFSVRVTNGKKLKIKYVYKDRETFKGSVAPHNKYNVYQISYDGQWYRISDNFEYPSRWIKAARTHRLGSYKTKDGEKRYYHEDLRNYTKGREEPTNDTKSLPGGYKIRKYYVYCKDCGGIACERWRSE